MIYPQHWPLARALVSYFVAIIPEHPVPIFTLFSFTYNFCILQGYLIVKMEYYVQLFTYWKSLEPIEWLAVVLNLITSLVYFANLYLFHIFVKAKPAGRKTVLGN